MIAHTKNELDKSSFHKSGFGCDDIKQPLPQKAGVGGKKVRFACHDQVCKIPHINDLSEEEIDAVWMHPDDFKDIIRECKLIILLIEHGQSDLEVLEDIELRGLEHHMSKQQEHAQGLQKLLYETVNKLQDFGDDNSTDISDLLASMCHRISSRQEDIARRTALQDEKDAKSCG